MEIKKRLEEMVGAELKGLLFLVLSEWMSKIRKRKIPKSTNPFMHTFNVGKIWWGKCILRSKKIARSFLIGWLLTMVMN